jgi:hypothetical protein
VEEAMAWIAQVAAGAVVLRYEMPAATEAQRERRSGGRGKDRGENIQKQEKKGRVPHTTRVDEELGLGWTRTREGTATERERRKEGVKGMM